MAPSCRPRGLAGGTPVTISSCPPVAAQQVLKFQAGAFPGSPVQPGCMCGFALYDLPNVDVVGYDVVSNRPKTAAYRAPGAPITSFAVESLLDDLARKLDMDPLRLREKNGHATVRRPTTAPATRTSASRPC